MARIFCIANQKGGVGKTTTAICLADALAKAGKKTLLIDLDPQCNATSGLGREPLAEHPFADGRPLEPCIKTTKTEGLFLLGGFRKFGDVEALARSDEVFAKQIHDQLRTELAEYDYVLIDCPPSLGRLTCLALECSDEVLIPIQCEYFAMEGVVQMIEMIRDAMGRKDESGTGSLEFAGILMTMYDARLEVTHEIDKQIRDFFGEIVFRTVIPRDVAVNEAPSHGLPIIDYAPRSRGARAYIELCMEILEHVS